MQLSETDKDTILSQFPHFKLYFETFVHKTVSDHDFEISIPIGSKYFAQTTNFKGNSVCILLEILQNNKIRNIEIKQVKFTAPNSIFYGTLIKKGRKESFSVEDVYFYKGKSTTHLTFIKKLELLKKIFESAELDKAFFGLPVIHAVDQPAEYFVKPSYMVRHVQHRYATKNNIYVSTACKPSNNKVIFKMTAELGPDMYNLFASDGKGNDVFIDFANVPDYKTSVMLNSVFRKIKENENLDALEESDDELEFEDIRPDKFVNLKKTCKIECKFNNKTYKWTPIRVLHADTQEPIITQQILCRLK